MSAYCMMDMDSSSIDLHATGIISARNELDRYTEAKGQISKDIHETTYAFCYRQGWHNESKTL